MTCVCGVGESYSNCCLPIHTGKLQPESPEQLMRARYAAFVKHELDFLKKTMLNKEDFSKTKLKLWLKNIKWKNLEIISKSDTTVEFKATYLAGKKLLVMHEKSKFMQINSNWLYAGEVK